jgi:predicted nucleic acid-binding protein
VIVIDASAVLELVLDTEAARRVADRLLAPAEVLHAPHLLDVEVTQAVRRYVASREVDARKGRQAIADLLDLPVVRHPHTVLLERAWELRRSVSAYDAMYVALAEGLDAPLVTRDERLARAHGHRARIEVL